MLKTNCHDYAVFFSSPLYCSFLRLGIIVSELLTHYLQGGKKTLDSENAAASLTYCCAFEQTRVIFHLA